MRSSILIAVEVEHDGTLTHAELAGTMGVWAQTLIDDIPDAGYVETESDDGMPAGILVLGATAAA